MAKLSVKVSEKGGVSLYGLRRFPITFYAQEWQEIAHVMPGILDYLDKNADKLSTKEDKPTVSREGHTSL